MQFSKNRFILSVVFFLILLSSCKEDKSKLFAKLPSSETGIHFRNLLQENHPEFNILSYPYFYNGGGVAVGDINNDGLLDIFFTGNMVKNRLYLNKGNMQFEDITEKAGIANKEGWCTGVTMVDINGDGLMDIYICRSGLSDPAYRKNLLYINNGDLTFTEEAAKYGLDDVGYGTQAVFFDYDKDGDLDMFLINQSQPKYSIGKIDYVGTRKLPVDSVYENKLFRNDNGHFVDVTKTSGIKSNPLTYSLGVNVSDINGDGWPDIYISNDFKEPDYLYINNHDGTFTDSLKYKIKNTSLYGMGVDINDYNNDLLPDIVQLDMLPEDNHAQKMHMGADNFNQYNTLFREGILPQFMRNTLQKNNGDGTFSEVGQLAGISNTDWSWSPLLADFDNDGFKDLFISNGYKRDNTNLEFLKYSYNESKRLQEGGTFNLPEYISHMEGIHLHNYIYWNNGNEQFENKVEEWGFEENTFSQGAVYADLDNDGALDLIINNTDAEASIYRNNARKQNQNHFLRVQLIGNKLNSLGYGAKVFLYAGGQKQYQEQLPVRGFQSSVDPVIHFGLGKNTLIDSVIVIWPDNRKQVLKQVTADQTLILNINQAETIENYSAKKNNAVFEEMKSPINFRHIENDFNDFSIQSLLPHYFSRSGPCMAKADVNGDGSEDVFIGGAKGQPATLWLQTKNGFTEKKCSDFITDKESEDVSAVFFDADNDGDMDLLVCSGGYEFAANDSALQCRLYINDGKGNFTRSKNALPPIFVSAGVVKATDFDKDGNIDLFIGGKVVPGEFPASPRSYLLKNNGKGIFKDVSATIGKNISNIGMISDALWLDVNGDGYPDLITAGEWNSIKVFINKKGYFEDASKQYIPFASQGWWNCLQLADVDGDGDLDIIAGNQGWNNQFHASVKEPMDLYAKDFDNNGTIDPILCYYILGKSYPAIGRDDLISQIPSLNKRYPEYTDYADATIDQIFTDDELKSALHLQTNILSSVWLENRGKEGFVLHELPVQAQQAPVYSIAIADINNDGKPDLILAGNDSYTPIKFGRFNGSNAVVLLNNGQRNFKPIPSFNSGLSMPGDVRSLLIISDKLFVGVNDAPLQCFEIK